MSIYEGQKDRDKGEVAGSHYESACFLPNLLLLQPSFSPWARWHPWPSRINSSRYRRFQGLDSAVSCAEAWGSYQRNQTMSTLYPGVGITSAKSCPGLCTVLKLPAWPSRRDGSQKQPRTSPLAWRAERRGDEQNNDSNLSTVADVINRHWIMTMSEILGRKNRKNPKKLGQNATRRGLKQSA
jgi:hypothetical protein